MIKTTGIIDLSSVELDGNQENTPPCIGYNINDLIYSSSDEDYDDEDEE